MPMACNSCLTGKPAFVILAVEEAVVSSTRSLETFLEMIHRRAPLEDAPFWKEVAAFNQMPQSQIDQFYGQYVAVYQGNIVDADADEAELALRFYRTFGYVSVYIHKVGTEEGLVEADDAI